MADVVATRYPAPPLVRATNIGAKSMLMLLLLVAVFDPALANLQDKAAVARAVGYPMLALAVPFVWYVWWRDRASFPWLADLLITITCFSDILGNQANLYDSIEWFDDWMHFMNTGLLAAAFILLTLPRDVGLGRVLERGLAFGATAAIAWELAEYFAFLSHSTEREFAYADTLGDLSLGTAGAVLAAAVIHWAWRRGHLLEPRPLAESAAS